MRNRLLILTALASLGAPPAIAEPASDDLSAWLRPRPNIEHYENQSEFVADILRWRAERDEIAARAARGELPPLASEQTEANDPSDWHVITGPENLDVAIKNAEGYTQPVYQEPKRFNRTTHVSFPLPELPLESLEDAPADTTIASQSSIDDAPHDEQDMVKMGIPDHILRDVDARIASLHNREVITRTQESFAPQPPTENLGAVLQDMVQHYSSSH